MNGRNLTTSIQSANRPIIFLAHSLGGIVIKEVCLLCVDINDSFRLMRMQALVHSTLSVITPKLHDIISSTKGVFYFGTPHLGSDWSSWHAVVLNIFKLYTLTNTRIVQNLTRNSEYLTKLQEHYYPALIYLLLSLLIACGPRFRCSAWPT
jgi:hypothetical protein